MDPATSQSSPDLAYNVLQSGAQVPNTIGNERVVTTAAHLSAQQLPNYAGNEFSHQSSEYLQQQAYFPRHNHSASQSSISTSSLKSVSPAPSLSGSDESGNTSKSTLLSGIVRSNASSRRGSVSSVVSNSGTPYAGHRKDGDKKFVCSYPGCKRAFSRNFNLSTHYVSAPKITSLYRADEILTVPALKLPYRTRT